MNRVNLPHRVEIVIVVDIDEGVTELATHNVLSEVFVERGTMQAGGVCSSVDPGTIIARGSDCVRTFLLHGFDEWCDNFSS